MAYAIGLNIVMIARNGSCLLVARKALENVILQEEDTQDLQLPLMITLSLDVDITFCSSFIFTQPQIGITSSGEFGDHPREVAISR